MDFLFRRLMVGIQIKLHITLQRWYLYGVVVVVVTEVLDATAFHRTLTYDRRDGHAQGHSAMFVQRAERPEKVEKSQDFFQVK